MSENHETVAKVKVDRRRFLAAGALTAGAAACSTPSVLMAQGSTVTSPIITSVSPGSGAEGTVITIFGNGFDPNPANNSVRLGTAASAEVIQANTLQLVVRIGPVAAVGPASLIVAIGTATAVPQETITEMVSGQTVTAIRLPSRRLCGTIELEAPSSFELTAVSLGTSVVPAAATKIEITLTEPCETGDKFSIYLHIVKPSGVPCILLDSFAVIELQISGTTVPIPISPEKCAEILAKLLASQLGGGFSVTSMGATIVISQSGLTTGSFGIITKT